MCAFGLGCLVGRVRGGRWSGVTETRLHAQASLIAGITTVLVLNLIGPGFPIGWLIIGYACFIHFGFKNLQITGMIVLLIGLSLNLAPALANGAVPVSELALQSVGDTNTAGIANIDGVRESSDTAASLSALGDVVPVPVFNVVVSLGDLIMLVAIADIAANLMLRARRREFDDAGVTFASEEGALPADAPQRIPVLSPLSKGFTSRPQHALHRRPRIRAASHSAHTPEHALEPAEPVIVLDEAEAYIEQPPPPTSPAIPDTEIAVVPHAESKKSVAVDLTGRQDRRPIIDLTTSPTDEQICEFLRRRAAADAQLEQLAPPSPGHRRNRSRRRRQRQVESTDFAETMT